MNTDENSRQQDSDESSASRSSSPESSSEVESTTRESPSRGSGLKSSSHSESEQDGSNTSDESSDDTSGQDEEITEPAQSRQQRANVPLKAISHSAKTLTPPLGFEKLKKQPLPSSTASSVMSNINGKQVFHITAPAFLPLSKINEISLAKILQGEPVLTHNGVNYGIPPDSIDQVDSSENIFLFDGESQTYHISPLHDIQSYHLQEMVNIPQMIAIGDQPELSQRAVKAPRKQPHCLKMRFQPIGSKGSSSETIGTSSEGSEEEEPRSQSHRGPSKKKDERKRRLSHADGEGSQTNAVPRKKSRKHSSQGNADGPSLPHIAESSRKESREPGKDRGGKKLKEAREAE